MLASMGIRLGAGLGTGMARRAGAWAWAPARAGAPRWASGEAAEQQQQTQEQTQSTEEQEQRALAEDFEEVEQCLDQLPAGAEAGAPEGFVRYYLPEEDCSTVAPASWQAVRSEVPGPWRRLFGEPGRAYHFYEETEQDDGKALTLTSFKNVIHVQEEFEGGVSTLVSLLTTFFVGEPLTEFLEERVDRGLETPPRDPQEHQAFHEELCSRCGLGMAVMGSRRMPGGADVATIQLVQLPHTEANPKDAHMRLTGVIASWPDDGRVVMLSTVCPDENLELRAALDSMIVGSRLAVSSGNPFSFQMRDQGHPVVRPLTPVK